ncbi:MAG TPA: hypothetical protein VFX13_06760 [Gaiellales bacterium]|jgi:hypothetical protein|nr:hypothetical protein [Gaiellales bacterium]
MDTGDEHAGEDVVSTRMKRRIVIAAVALGVAGLGGTALATSSPGGNSFFDDVAHRLGVSPAKLQSAVNGALADRLDRLVQQGKLTRAQADGILKHARADGGGFPFGGWAPYGRPRHHVGFGTGPMGGPLAGAAGYLGLPADDLMKELRSGKSPAAIAKANGKSVGGLESALIAPVKARLDAAVKAGRLTKSQERHVLGMVTRGTDDFVTHGFRFKMRLHHDWHDGGSSQPTAFGL